MASLDHEAASLDAKPKLFLSYFQGETATTAERFYGVATAAGNQVWLDFYAPDKSEAGMRRGIQEADIVIVFMSKHYLQRPFCLKELTWAQEFGKRVQVVIDPQDKGRITDFRSGCPPGFEWIFLINFVNLDVSDRRWLLATANLVLQAAVNAPHAPSLPEALDVAMEDLAIMRSSTTSSGLSHARTTPSNPSGEGTGGDVHSQRLLSLRNKMFYINADLVKKDDRPEIGKGGQSVIEMAEYQGRKVAVKVYGVEKREEERQERAYTEALLLGIMSRLPVGSRHIVKYFGMYVTEISRFLEIGLVLELAPDRSLDIVLYGTEVPVFWNSDRDSWFRSREEFVKERGLGWMSEITEALRFLHEDLKITHCDIKAGNVLLFEQGNKTKLTDFGSCYLEPDASWQFSRSFATKGSVGWTDRYKAPERIDSELLLSPKSDIWGLGLIAYEILHGLKAWSQVRDKELAAQQTRDVSALQTEGTPWKPQVQQQNILKVMRRCLVLDPNARPAASAIPNILRPPVDASVSTISIDKFFVPQDMTTPAMPVVSPETICKLDRNNRTDAQRCVAGKPSRHLCCLQQGSYKCATPNQRPYRGILP